MDEVRRKEQFKRRIPNETSSSSSPVPYDEMQRWNSLNIPMPNSACGRPPISTPDTVQSSPYSAKGKNVQGVPSSFPKCYSPKNSESESRPSKHRRRMLDLQLPADEYIDTDEVTQVNEVNDSDYTSPSPDKNRKPVVGNGKLFMLQGDASKSELHVSKPRTLADLNEPVIMEEATSVASVEFIHPGGSNSDAQ